MQKKTVNYSRRYVVTAYLVFWCSVALVAAAVFASGMNMTVMQWGSAVASWTPTMVLLVMFKKLFPGITLKEWLKQAFAPRINFRLLFTVSAVLVIAMAASVYIVALRTDQPVMNILDLSLPTLASALFFTLIQGATGEEAGWRGYLQPIMEQKAGGVIKGSLLVGLVWSFWHLPLWFATGLLGQQLVIYIVTFIIGNLSLSVMIGTCYSRCRNLFVPIWIHFVSNAIATPYIGDPMEIRYWLVSCYVLAAISFALWHRLTAGKVQGSVQRSSLLEVV